MAEREKNMRNMKKALAAVAAVATLASLTACGGSDGGNDAKANAGPRLTELAATAPPAMPAYLKKSLLDVMT